MMASRRPPEGGSQWSAEARGLHSCPAKAKGELPPAYLLRSDCLPEVGIAVRPVGIGQVLRLAGAEVRAAILLDPLMRLRAAHFRARIGVGRIARIGASRVIRIAGLGRSHAGGEA